MIIDKYCASGNDFIIFETDNLDSEFLSNFAKKYCHRQRGIGADGMIAIKKEDDKDYHFTWGFYNQDGSIAEMCGNGARAAAHYAYMHKIAPKDMSFKTVAGIIKANILDDDFVKVRLTKPEILHENLNEFGKVFMLINTGVPHLVTLDGVHNYNEENAKSLREKYNANVNYVSAQNGELKVRTYERGVGETLACGTGMCASFYYARQLKLVKDEANVYPKSNELCKVFIDDGYLYFCAKVVKTFDVKLDC